MLLRPHQIIAFSLVLIGMSIPTVYGETTEVVVQPLIAREFPKLDDARTQRILTKAKSLISTVVGEDVTFKIAAPLDHDAFLKSLEERAAPYMLPQECSYDINETPIEKYHEFFSAYAATPSNLKRVCEVLPSSAEKPQTATEAADVLLAAYMRATVHLQELKGLDGAPLIGPKNWHRYSLGRWGVFLQSYEWSDAYTLYLSNALMIDDAIRDPDALTILHKGIVNAVALQASKSAMIGYFSVFSDDLVGGNLSLKRLAEPEKDDLLAYLIAQQVGVHLISANHKKSSSGGLARSVQLLADKADFTDVQRMKIGAKPEVDQRLVASYTLKVLIRMDILLAKEEWKLAMQEAERADDALFDKSKMKDLEARKTVAESHLIRI